MDISAADSQPKTRFSNISERLQLEHWERSQARHPNVTGTFIHDSYSSSIDFPAYISWQTLSTGVSDKLRQGSVRINRSNCIEWVNHQSIKEENERSHLLGYNLLRKGPGEPESSTSTESDISKPGVTEAVRGGANWRVAAFLLVNAALGAGVLNYPVAYDRIGGIGFSTIIQLILVVMLASTMVVMVYCSDLNRDNTYHDVLHSMCGKRAQQLAAVSIMSTCFGICVTFLIIIGDQYDRILATLFGNDFCHNWYLDRRFTIPLTALITIWPMCYFKRLDFLRYASTLGIFAMLYVVFLNVYEYYALDITPPEVKSEPTNILSLFAALPVVCFAYQTHEIVVPIYACMQERRISTFARATMLALILLFALYCMAGTFGYLTFGKRVAPDIMQMYNAGDPIVTIGIIALVIKMITTYPPMMFCGRGAIDGLYAEFAKLSTEKFIHGEYQRRVIITTIWNIIVLILSIYTPNITIAIELLGSFAACNVFVFPGLCMVAISRRFIDGFFSLVIRCYGFLVMLTGVFMFGIVMVQVVSDLQSVVSEEHLLCT